MLEQNLPAEKFHLCDGVWTGFLKDHMLERVGFAIDTDMIIEAMDRLEALIARFSTCPESTIHN